MSRLFSARCSYARSPEGSIVRGEQARNRGLIHFYDEKDFLVEIILLKLILVI